MSTSSQGSQGSRRRGASQQQQRAERAEGWVVASRIEPQGEEGLRWIQLTIAREVCPELLGPSGAQRRGQARPA